jgi:hypothetical protein
MVIVFQDKNGSVKGMQDMEARANKNNLTLRLDKELWESLKTYHND